MEPFVLIVAHHDNDVGINGGDLVAELLHRPAIAIEPLLADLEAGLLFEILFPAPRFDQLRETIYAPAERVLRVLAIIGGAQVPTLGRRRQQRSVRRAEPENDIGHDRLSPRSIGAGAHSDRMDRMRPTFFTLAYVLFRKTDTHFSGTCATALFASTTAARQQKTGTLTVPSWSRRSSSTGPTV